MDATPSILLATFVKASDAFGIGVDATFVRASDAFEITVVGSGTRLIARSVISEPILFTLSVILVRPSTLVATLDSACFARSDKGELPPFIFLFLYFFYIIVFYSFLYYGYIIFN